MRVFVLGGDPHFCVERKEKKGWILAGPVQVGYEKLC